MIDSKFYSYLGLAKKAGKAVSGNDGVLNTLRSKKSSLVILASDASDNTKKTMTDKCKYYNVPIIPYGNKKSLGNSIGMNLTSAISITDKNFAQLISGVFEEINGGGVE